NNHALRYRGARLGPTTLGIPLLCDHGMKDPVNPEPFRSQFLHQRVKKEGHVLVDAKKYEFAKAPIALRRREVENIDKRLLRLAKFRMVEYAFGEAGKGLNRKSLKVFRRCAAVKRGAEARECRRSALEHGASARDATCRRLFDIRDGRIGLVCAQRGLTLSAYHGLPFLAGTKHRRNPITFIIDESSRPL
ncbi:MAG TPA: hypothetical protein VKR31_12915, partial [Rhizomicrobium sp.]|nr:hypothetical protein [Rhizomicrobium sp.]